MCVCVCVIQMRQYSTIEQLNPCLLGSVLTCIIINISKGYLLSLERCFSISKYLPALGCCLPRSHLKCTTHTGLKTVQTCCGAPPTPTPTLTLILTLTLSNHFRACFLVGAARSIKAFKRAVCQRVLLLLIRTFTKPKTNTSA